MSKYKRPGYTAAYKRLRFAQEANNNRNFSWIGKGFLYILLGVGPILYFQILSILANSYFK